MGAPSRCARSFQERRYLSAGKPAPTTWRDSPKTDNHLHAGLRKAGIPEV
jgi:hypothetical protein